MTSRFLLVSSACLAAIMLAGCPTTPKQTETKSMGVPKKVEAVKAPTGPLARVEVVSDNYHGTMVADPYRYMENWKSPEVVQWVKRHADFTRNALDQLPGRAKLAARISELSQGTINVTGLQIRGSKHIYLKRAPGDKAFKLMLRERFDSEERLIVDVGTNSTVPTNISFFSASPNGRYIAYAVTTAGREVATLSIFDLVSHQPLADTVNDVVMDEGFHWHPDSRSFYYLKTADSDNLFLNAKVTHHRVGQSDSNNVSFFGAGISGNTVSKELTAVDIPIPRPSQTANVMVMGVRHGDDKYLSLYSAALAGLTEKSPWRRIANPADQITDFSVVGDDIYMLTTKGAPRGKLTQTSAARGSASSAKQIIGEGEYVIRGFVVAQDGIYLREMSGGIDVLQWLSIKKGAISNKREFVRLPFDLTISEMIADVKRKGVTVRMQGWIEPPQYVAIGTKALELVPLDLMPKSTANFSDIEEQRIYAEAKDGTKIPLSLLYRRGTRLDGFNPAILTAYGAYGISLSPSFNADRLAWLERGGVLATCHVRGGGEYGETWHRSGQKASKENTITDLIACAEQLIQRKFTQPARLALTGGSAGGITAGGALVRRPELFAAVVPSVGVMDALRFETTSNGKPNIAEFGTTKNAADFKWLYATSAYHQVKDGTNYPGVMVTTGANDPRVEPWMSAKFAARMLAANTGLRPTLLRVNYQTGHGAGASRDAQIQALADVYSFALWQMGDAEFQPPGSAAIIAPPISQSSVTSSAQAPQITK